MCGWPGYHYLSPTISLCNSTIMPRIDSSGAGLLIFFWVPESQAMSALSNKPISICVFFENSWTGGLGTVGTWRRGASGPCPAVKGCIWTILPRDDPFDVLGHWKNVGHPQKPSQKINDFNKLWYINIYQHTSYDLCLDHILEYFGMLECWFNDVQCLSLCVCVSTSPEM